MTDEQRLLDVIVESLRYLDDIAIGRVGSYQSDAKFILAALREAGYEIVPSDTAKLGRAVEAIRPALYGRVWVPPCGVPLNDPSGIVDAIYTAADVERQP